MYKIKLRAEARAHCSDASTDKWELCTDSQLRELDGIDCQDNFSEYFHGAYGSDKNEQALIDKGVHSGYMHFVYEDGVLWTITTYNSDEELTRAELDALVDYTQGQWSDGIGEGFEQFACYDDEDGEYFISPWFSGQEVEVEQEVI
jgi:hypothetical protein